jgi:SAM-dependent methyltransferase
MNVFRHYSHYYDLLYGDKDYVGEAEFICQLIKSNAPNARSVLDLGCGTGIHAALLAKAGYEVQGIDLSADMLQKASDRLAQLASDVASRLSFAQGDVRTVRLNQQFDVIISLFHVISYQTTQQDLLATFETIKAHLKPGGIFIFDFWYGPAVLTDAPTVRVKRLEDEKIKVTRISEPVIYPNKNIVEVNYSLFVKDLNNGAIEELKETHRMRYLFETEIALLLKQTGLQSSVYGEWMTSKTPGLNSWSVYCIG